MTDTERNGTRLMVLFAVPAAAIFGTGWYLSRRTPFLAESFTNEALVTGAMAVAVPLLYLGLVAVPRKQGAIPPLVGFLICTLLAGAILPEAQETALGYVERALVATEGLLIVLVALKVARIVRYVKEEKASEVPAGGQPFTSYRTGYKTLFIALSMIGALELVGMHLLLANSFGATTAWIVTALTIYGFLFLLADYVAMVKRPSMIYQGKFYFQMGLRWSAVIPLGQIRRVEKLAYNLDTSGMLQCAVQRHLANVVIHFTEEQTVTGPFGIRKKGRALITNVDQLPEMIHALTSDRESVIR